MKLVERLNEKMNEGLTYFTVVDSKKRVLTTGGEPNKTRDELQAYFSDLYDTEVYVVELSKQDFMAMKKDNPDILPNSMGGIFGRSSVRINRMQGRRGNLK